MRVPTSEYLYNSLFIQGQIVVYMSRIELHMLVLVFDNHKLVRYNFVSTTQNT